MNISQKKIDELNSIITIELKKDDYLEKVEKSIKEQSKKSKLPGFRPGMVPMAHIKKLYGKSILVDEVNNILSKTLNKYIEENQIQILGQPLPADSTEIPKWNFEDDFTFSYELGLAPDFKIEISKQDKVNAWSIFPDDETLKARTKNLRRAYGKMTNPEFSEPGDILYALFEQLTSEESLFENGIVNTASLKTEMVKDEAQLALLLGLKKDDVRVVDLIEVFSGNVKAVATLLKIEEGLASDLKSKFRMTVKNVNRLGEADLNEEFFNKVFPDDKLQSEEDLNLRIAKEIRMMTEPQAIQKLDTDIIQYVISKFKANLPDNFLKRWLRVANEDRFSSLEIEQQYYDFQNNLKWTLIENKILKENSIDIKPDEMIELAKNKLADQYRMYSATPLAEDQLAQYAVQMLQDRDQSSKLFEEMKARKTLDYIKSIITLDTKEIAYDEFLKLEK